MKKLSYHLFMLLMLVQSVAAAPNIRDLDNNQWVKLAANTLMLGAILFLVYIYAVPSDKADKSRQWIIAAAVLALCSLLAYQFMTDVWFWQTKLIDNLFHRKVLINLGVMAAGLFGILVIAQAISADLKTQMDKTAVKYLAILIILFMAFNTALQPFYKDGKLVKTWDEVEKDYQYIWQKGDVKNVMLYLFGDAACTDEDGRRYCYYDTDKPDSKDIEGYGILRPPYVLIFGLSLMLAIWAFKTFKFITEIDWLQWIIAILLAAVFAHRGPTADTFAFIAQLVSIFIIQKSIQGADKTGNSWFSWGAAVVIVGAITFYVFPQYAWSPFKWVFGLGFWWGLGILMGIGALGWFAFSSFKKKDKDKAVSRWKHDFGVTIGNLLKKAFLGSKRFKGLAKFLDNTFLPMRLSMPDGEMNSIFRDMNVEIMALMNFMLRLEVFGGKLRTVENTEKQVAESFKLMVSKKHTYESIHTEWAMYKHGTGFVYDRKGSTGKVVFGRRPVIARGSDGKAMDIAADAGKSNRLLGGVFGTYLVYETFSGPLLKWLFSDRYDTNPEHMEDDMHKSFTAAWQTWQGQFNRSYEMMMTSNSARIKRYGMVHQIHHARSMILDQYRMTGEYYHTYLYAHPEAEAEWYEIEPESDPVKKTKIVGNPLYPKSTIGYTHGDHPFEMDKEGFIIQDINENMMEVKLKARIAGSATPKTYKARRVDPRNMIWKDFSDTMAWQRIEWQGFLDDLRDGRHHPFSRKVSDYQEAHKNNNFKYKDVARSVGTPGRKDPAFDREGLKDMGNFRYIGRKHYWSDTKDINNIGEKNPFPTVTSLGLTMYLKDVVIRMMENEAEARKQLRRYVYDSGSEGIGLFTRDPAEVETK